MKRNSSYPLSHTLKYIKSLSGDPKGSAEGNVLGGNIILVRKISEYLKNQSDVQSGKDILQSLKSLTENFDYRSVLLLDKNGKVKLAYPDADTLEGDPVETGPVINFKTS